MSVVSDTRSSRRLSGQIPELPPMVKQPSLHPSRSASKQASKQPTREPTLEPDDAYLQAQSETEYKEQDEPETPPKIQKGKALEIQVIHPAPSHAAEEQVWEDEPSELPPTEDEARQIAELYYSLSELYEKWDPKALLFEKSPNGLI